MVVVVIPHMLYVGIVGPLMLNSVITSYKDSIVAILHIQNSIILIQTTEYNNFMLG